jgi:hypothetical protein
LPRPRLTHTLLRLPTGLFYAQGVAAPAHLGNCSCVALPSRPKGSDSIEKLCQDAAKLRRLVVDLLDEEERVSIGRPRSFQLAAGWLPSFSRE